MLTSANILAYLCAQATGAVNLHGMSIGCLGGSGEKPFPLAPTLVWGGFLIVVRVKRSIVAIYRCTFGR
jgi:hypothetical protein